MTPIRRAWKLHHQFRRAMSTHHDVPIPPIDGERLLSAYIERQGPQGRDALADKRPGEMAAAAWLRKLCNVASTNPGPFRDSLSPQGVWVRAKVPAPTKPTAPALPDAPF